MAVGFLRRSVRGEVSSHSVRPACLGHRVSTKTLCLLGQPKKAIGSKSPIGPWLATLPSTCLQVSRTEWRRQKTQMEPQGWRTPPLLQSTKRTRTAVLKKTTRTESVHVQAVGLDAGNLPGTEPVERCFLLTSPFIGPSGTVSALYGISSSYKQQPEILLVTDLLRQLVEGSSCHQRFT